MHKEFADPSVKVDVSHCYLVGALVLANKPDTILELGLGGGGTTDSILSALTFNEKQVRYDLVDSWLDFNGIPPIEAHTIYTKAGINIITSTEKEFIEGCQDTYDFIMSDADHNHTQEWFEDVYNRILNPGGILIYHDVNLYPSQFPGLKEIYYKAMNLGISHKLFNRSSLSDERCERGLLVLFKPM